MISENAKVPQRVNRREPAFDQPWHAQLFALTVHLNESGAFSWGDWVTRFSTTLRQHGLNRDLNGGEDYFAAWLETLETFLAETGQVAPADAEVIRARWEEAYLTTPHGAPVHLHDDR
ncbi:nitrile hydratase accessory protein [Phaeobacter sp. C3_T13_0]|uniref:nitrile hydratase accessory protein n=1 Tax=Phaeobacter cretensis TaxID=3342641 RepID=UPI0039BC49C7